MSSLLEQAIIDATALKEAAVKNAETAILNKYSDDIREAVESLLEQEEEAPATDDTAELETPNIPLAAAPTGELEDVITLNLEELKEMAETLAEEDLDLIGDKLSQDALSTGDEPPTGAIAHDDNSDEVATVGVDIALEEEVDPAQIDAILEELIVDIAPQKSGWAGTPETIMQYKTQLKMAQLASEKAHTDIEDLKSAAERLAEERDILKKNNEKIIKAFRGLKENFDKVNLSNARILYANRVLTNNSLNERQKHKIVVALSKADSIEEAKVIFETLENAVGSVTGKARPQSLRETIERPSATLPRRAPTKTADSPAMDRMQVLAGIKKLQQ